MDDLVKRLRDKRHCNDYVLRQEAATEIERLSVDYNQAYSDGRSMLIHEFKIVCDQRDALLTKAALSDGTSDYERGYESCRRFIGDFHGPVVQALDDYLKENRLLVAENAALRTALHKIAVIDYANAATNCCATFAANTANEALTARTQTDPKRRA